MSAPTTTFEFPPPAQQHYITDTQLQRTTTREAPHRCMDSSGSTSAMLSFGVYNVNSGIQQQQQQMGCTRWASQEIQFLIRHLTYRNHHQRILHGISSLKFVFRGYKLHSKNQSSAVIRCLIFHSIQAQHLSN